MNKRNENHRISISFLLAPLSPILFLYVSLNFKQMESVIALSSLLYLALRQVNRLYTLSSILIFDD